MGKWAARLAEKSTAPPYACTDRTAKRGLLSVLAVTPGGGAGEISAAPMPACAPLIDRTDLAEVLGNLLENAARHAKSRVRVATATFLDQTTVSVEDDGPGIANELRSTALARGSRLDERGSGAGIGLAIVQDVLDAYEWTLELSASELGGLKASFHATIS